MVEKDSFIKGQKRKNKARCDAWEGRVMGKRDGTRRGPGSEGERREQSSEEAGSVTEE